MEEVLPLLSEKKLFLHSALRQFFSLSLYAKSLESCLERLNSRTKSLISSWENCCCVEVLSSYSLSLSARVHTKSWISSSSDNARSGSVVNTGMGTSSECGTRRLADSKSGYSNLRFL